MTTKPQPARPAPKALRKLRNCGSGAQRQAAAAGGQGRDCGRTAEELRKHSVPSPSALPADPAPPAGGAVQTPAPRPAPLFLVPCPSQVRREVVPLRPPHGAGPSLAAALAAVLGKLATLSDAQRQMLDLRWGMLLAAPSNVAVSADFLRQVEAAALAPQRDAGTPAAAAGPGRSGTSGPGLERPARAPGQSLSSAAAVVIPLFPESREPVRQMPRKGRFPRGVVSLAAGTAKRGGPLRPGVFAYVRGPAGSPNDGAVVRLLAWHRASPNSCEPAAGWWLVEGVRGPLQRRDGGADRQLWVHANRLRRCADPMR